MEGGGAICDIRMRRAYGSSPAESAGMCAGGGEYGGESDAPGSFGVSSSNVAGGAKDIEPGGANAS